jgi:hypothetical protein
VPPRGDGDALGLNQRQPRDVSPARVGPRLRPILRQMKAIRHLEGGGRPEARRSRVRLRPLSDDHLDPGMGLQPRGDGAGLSGGEQGQGPPPFQV